MATERGSVYTTITPEQRRQAAIVNLVLSSIIVAGSSWILIRSGREYRTARKAGQRFEGARKLRRILIVCLSLSDLLIALSNIFPAVLSFTNTHMGRRSCDPPGVILAMACWWQYGFSVAIACTTYMSLRYPLSRVKAFAESWWGDILGFVFLSGVVQAIVWWFAHGYVAWNNFCYYGAPIDLATHLMQFCTSLFIALIYIPLISFLRRPELCAECISPRAENASLPSSGHNVPSLSIMASSEPEIPPWERLSIPSFNALGLEESIQEPIPAHQDEARPITQSLPETPARPLQAVQMPAEDYDTSPRTVRPGDMPVIPPHSGREQPAVDFPTVQVFSPEITPVSPVRPFMHQSGGSFLSAASSETAYSRGVGNEEKSLFRVISSGSADTAGTIHTVATGKADREEEDASLDFAGMLSYIPAEDEAVRSAPHQARRRSTIAIPAALEKYEWARRLSVAMPKQHKGRMETMASYMNRCTSYFLLCFPLTHFMICCISVGRYIAYAKGDQASLQLEILTIWTVFGQSLADIIIFGWIERWTQLAYRHEMQQTYDAGPLRSTDEVLVFHHGQT